MNKTITIKIKYDGATVKDGNKLEETLRDSLQEAISDGLLEPRADKGENVVDEFTVTIE